MLPDGNKGAVSMKNGIRAMALLTALTATAERGMSV
jgi:hypothetical protein